MGSLRKLKLRRPDFCVDCDCAIEAGLEAWWDSGRRTVTCVVCRQIELGLAQERGAGADAAATVMPAPVQGSGGAAPVRGPGGPAPVRGPGKSVPPPSFGKGAKAPGRGENTTGAPPGAAPEQNRAGASARREYERRRANRERRTREAHPLIGGALVAFRKAPQHEEAWRKGAAGEAAIARALAKALAGTPVVLLHDRRMPRGRGNIDHLAVAPSGVYVIDAKNIEGRVRVQAPLRGPKKLMIKGRNQIKLIEGLDRQVVAVTEALAEAAAKGGLMAPVTVRGCLCFINADLGLIGTQRIHGNEILGRWTLAKRLKARGSLEPAMIRQLADHLATAFPTA